MKNCGHTKADYPAGSWRSEKIPAASHLLDCPGGHPRIHHHSAPASVLLRASWSFALRRRLADLDLRHMPTGLRPYYWESVRPRGAETTPDHQPDGHTDWLSDPLPGHRSVANLSVAGYRRFDCGESLSGTGLYCGRNRTREASSVLWRDRHRVRTWLSRRTGNLRLPRRFRLRVGPIYAAAALSAYQHFLHLGSRCLR